MRSFKLLYGIVVIAFIFLCNCGDAIDNLKANKDYLEVSGIDDNFYLYFFEKDTIKSIVIYCENDKKWQIEDYNEDWFHLDRIKGANGDTIRIEVDDFTVYHKDERIESFSIKVGDRRDDIKVKQYSSDVEFVVTPKSIEIKKEKNRLGRITVISNTKWISEQNKDWYTLSPRQGDSGELTLNVAGDSYEGDSTRRDTLVLYPKGYSNYPELKREVVITQEPEPFFYTKDLKLYFNPQRKKYDIKIHANVDWDYPNNGDWYSFEFKKDNSKVTTVIVTINDNIELIPRSEIIHINSNDARVDPIDLEINYDIID